MRSIGLIRSSVVARPRHRDSGAVDILESKQQAVIPERIGSGPKHSERTLDGLTFPVYLLLIIGQVFEEQKSSRISV